MQSCSKLMTSFLLSWNLLGKCLALVLIGIGLFCLSHSLKPENDLQQIERLSASFVGKLVEQACLKFDTDRRNQPQVKIQNVEQTGQQAVVSVQITAPGESIFTDLVLSRNETNSWKVLGVSEIRRTEESGSLSQTSPESSNTKTEANEFPNSEPPVLDDLLKTAFQEKAGTQVHRF